MKKYEISGCGNQLVAYRKERCPFDEGYAALQKKGVLLATASEIVAARILSTREHPVNLNGTWVAENYNYFPNGDILIASREHNPILQKPKAATAANRRGKEFFLDDKIAEELRDLAKEDAAEAVKSGVLLVTRKLLNVSMLTRSFDEIPEAYFLFRQNAKSYGELLAGLWIKVTTQWVCSESYVKAEKPFVRSLWIDGLGNNSDLLNFNLDYKGRVTGICPASQQTGLGKL